MIGKVACPVAEPIICTLFRPDKEADIDRVLRRITANDATASRVTLVKLTCSIFVFFLVLFIPVTELALVHFTSFSY